jgi:hypothetical protein
MASFILRQIDPDLWARVTAKAAAEGLTVKQLVLKALTQYVALLTLLVLTTACGAANPTQATPIADPAAVPTSISLTSVSGVGSGTGQVYISALVKDASGKGVGAAIVTFTTTAGTFLATPITSDAGGLAQASLTTPGNATITAKTGAASGSLDVVPTPVPVVVPPYVPLPTPPIVVPPVVPTPPAPLVLNVSLTCTAEPHGPLGTPPTVCNLATSYNGAALDSALVNSVTWDWGDGLDQTVTSSPLGSRNYLQAGTYRIQATVTATPPTSGPKTAAAVASVTVL